MKTYKNNIRCVIEIIDSYTKEVITTQTEYFSGIRRYYSKTDIIPQRIKDFIKWSKRHEMFNTYNPNYSARTIVHYY